MECVTPVDQPQLQMITLSECVGHFSQVLNNVKITTHLHETVIVDQGLHDVITYFLSAREKKGTVYIIGNGGSAAIASHASIDFINMTKMRSHALLDMSVTTCISNDYGYDQIYAKQLAQFIRPEDILIAISSSGQSKNITNAVAVAKMHGAKIITLSGFSEDNPLRMMGNYNIWLNSRDYGQVEIGHAFILHYFTDRLREIPIMEHV